MFCLPLRRAITRRAAAPDTVDDPTITLGHAAVALYGPWRFQIGDDPVWAEPTFNDVNWGTVNLRPPDAPADPDLGTGSDVPGWTARGFPTYSGFAWYRLRVNLQPAPGPLSLKMEGIDDAYQVFVNGQQIGSFGRFGAHHVTAYTDQPRSFRLPKNIRSGPINIAIRVWMDSSSRFETPDAGGMHEPPVLGLAPHIGASVRLDWDFVTHNIGSGFLEGLVLLLALGVSVTLFWLQHGEKSYIWLAAVCLVTLLGNLVLQLSNFTTLIPQTTAVLLRDVLFAPLRIGLWVLFWASWFHLESAGWMRRSVWMLVAILAGATLMLRPPLHGRVIPLHAAVYLHPLVLWTKLALAVPLLIVTIIGIRKNRFEGWLALPVILIAVVANYQVELRLLHVRILYTVLGFRLSLGQISTMLSVCIVVLMVSRRFLHAQRREVQWRLQVAQARELQRVILPSTLPQVPGLVIESEYRPSLEVGGDFFQIIPDRSENSVLIVVGDVTGKGLRAGMLVALIVGAVDTAARQNSDPGSLLNVINNRLCERGYATATCLILKITADGLVSVANAGQLPPYLNGNEVETEGALPIGTLPDIEYTTMQFELNDGDILTLITDGIVEAQDEKGQLFGFPRVSQMLLSGANALDLANAAQRFGQEDDILVLRVKRTVSTGALISAAA